MSYIPDCRQKYEKDVDKPYNREREDISDDAINAYWYGLLNKKDSEFIFGYDYCVNHVLCNLFDNLDSYASELKEVGIDVEDIDENVVDGAYGAECENIHANKDCIDDREIKYYSDYTEDELEEMSQSTRLMLLIKEILLLHAEMNRDEIVTSMIENMDDKEYEENMNKITGGE